MKLLPRFLPIALGAIVSVGASHAFAESLTLSTLAGSPGVPGENDGSNNVAKLKGPNAVVVNSSGVVYFTDGSAIRQCSPTGSAWMVTTLAGAAAIHGFVNATNLTARFDLPHGLALGPGDTLFVADTLNNAVRQLAPLGGGNWAAITLAGAGRLVPGDADGTNSAALFDHPYGITRDAAGVLYVTDTYNHTIRKVTPQGTNWVVTTIAGMAGVSGSVDATNILARFDSPDAITIDPGTGVLYVADFNNNSIRAVTPQGTNWIVTTIAGLGGAPAGSANGTNTNARFNGPAAIAVVSPGSLVVADSVNNTLRSLKKFGTNWVVGTLAGLPGVIGSADGTGAAARMSVPSGVTVSATGQRYVADTGNYTLRLGTVAAVLETKLTPGQLQVLWPTGVAGFFLETAGKIPGGSWRTLSNGIVTVADNFTFVTNTTANEAIFRLRKP